GGPGGGSSEGVCSEGVCGRGGGAFFDLDDVAEALNVVGEGGDGGVAAEAVGQEVVGVAVLALCDEGVGLRLEAAGEVGGLGRRVPLGRGAVEAALHPLVVVSGLGEVGAGDEGGAEAVGGVFEGAGAGEGGAGVVGVAGAGGRLGREGDGLVEGAGRLLVRLLFVEREAEVVPQRRARGRVGVLALGGLDAPAERRRGALGVAL